MSTRWLGSRRAATAASAVTSPRPVDLVGPERHRTVCYCRQHGTRARGGRTIPLESLTDRCWQVIYRAGQFAQALWPRVAPRDAALARAILEPPAQIAFERMPPADRRHAARLCRRLLALYPRDSDLATAALLHDLGKVARAERGRVRLPHRVAHVLLKHFAPAFWGQLTDQPTPGPLHGLYLLRHHAQLGAAWAHELGVSRRACELIAAHDGADCTPGLVTTVALLRAEDQRS